MKIATPRNVPFYDALTAALELDDVSPTESPEDIHMAVSRPDEGSLEWGSLHFGNIKALTDMSLYPSMQTNSSQWSRVSSKGKPEKTVMKFRCRTEPGVRILHAVGSNVKEITDWNIPDLNIPITWKNGTPSTRRTDVDNVDIIFLKKNGMFAQLQISMTNINGRFTFAIQELYNGQIVRTTRQKASMLPTHKVEVGGFTALVVPLFSRNAHPAGDYRNAFSGADNFIKMAVAHGACIPLSDCVRAKWDPHYPAAIPTDMEKAGWKSATVAWYNLVLGCGQVVCEEDGTIVFVHFKQIEDGLGKPIWHRTNPVLEPESAVMVKYEPGDRGYKATALRYVS